MSLQPESVPQSIVEFATTQWSVVRTAGEFSHKSQAALDELCQAYWPPIYAFIRRKGKGPEDAKDLTQEFFARLLRRESFADADPQRGRFRTFLLSALQGFLTDEHRRATRQKRGGGVEPISLDDNEAEESFLEPAAPELRPDELYDRRWRLVLLCQALRRLESEWTAESKGPQFARLKEFLTGPAEVGAYVSIAAQLDASPRTIAVTIHRMRKRYRELVREELAQTVTNATEFEDELKLLFG